MIQLIDAPARRLTSHLDDWAMKHEDAERQACVTTGDVERIRKWARKKFCYYQRKLTLTDQSAHDWFRARANIGLAMASDEGETRFISGPKITMARMAIISDIIYMWGKQLKEQTNDRT